MLRSRNVPVVNSAQYHAIFRVGPRPIGERGAQVLVCGVAVRELAPTDYRDGAHALVMRATSTFPLVASSDADLVKQTDRPIAPEELRTRR